MSATVEPQERLLSSREFDALMSRRGPGLYISERIELALRLHLVGGASWRRAANTAGVTVPGAWRALRRLRQKNEGNVGATSD